MKDATEMWLFIIATVGAFLTALWKTWTNLRRLSRMVDEFLGYEDPFGEHVPGLSERVTVLESEVSELKRLMSIHLATAHGIGTDV